MKAGGLFSVALSLGSIPACAGTSPAGRYPAPFVHGARTFLPGHLSVIAGTAVQPTDATHMDAEGRRVKTALATALPNSAVYKC